MNKLTIINGGCDCGNINYRFEVDKPLASLSVRACTCSFCTKQGAIYTSDPEGKLRINIKETKNIQKYQFASKLTEFIFCKVCGVMPLSVTETDGNMFALINIKTSDVNPDDVSVQTVSFGEESDEESIRRRKSGWIPVTKKL